MSSKTIHVSLVGMRFHAPPFNVANEILRAIPVLKLEPKNAHDKNAVAVHLLGHKVGYIDKTSATRVNVLLQKGVTFQIEVGAITSQTIKLALKFELVDLLAAPPKPNPKNTSGIYKISISADKYVYIGQSNSINSRIKDHWKKLVVQEHPNKHLQAYWNDLGESHFSAEIVEMTPEHLSKGLEQQRWLANREKFWIKKYRETTNCLNILDGEVIPTKKALTELAIEEKALDLKIKEEKKQMTAELKVLEEKIKEARRNELDLNSKIQELSTFVFKNSGIVGFFIGSSSKLLVEQKKATLESLRSQLLVAQKERPQLLEEFLNLKKKRRGLKTTKQIKNLVDNRLIGFGIAPKAKKIY
jgi:group I intron endonuclease